MGSEEVILAGFEDRFSNFTGVNVDAGKIIPADIPAFDEM